MQSNEIRQRFLNFFEKRGHKIIPSASLVPENDPSVLFNTAGMQPLVPYLLGEKHPQGTRLVNVQKCVRTVDIDDVGDNIHATFFEMLGNWSLGDYFKEDAIKWSYELLTSKEEGFGLDPERLYVTVFEGDQNAPKDTESFEIWKKVGMPENRIYFMGADTNWWPSVKGKDTWTGPTGPCSEMFYDITPEGLGDLSKEEYIEADDKRQVVEIWNDVFMEYEKKDGKILGKLKSNNVDTGAGLERLAVLLQGVDNIYDVDLFKQIMVEIKTASSNWNLKSTRIVTDHIRASIFIIGDGVIPSNTDRGYVLRRLLRRAIRFSDNLGLSKGIVDLGIVDMFIDKYKDIYSNLSAKRVDIKNEILAEETKFRQTLNSGLKHFEKISDKNINGKDAFDLYQSYGFPIEITMELAKEKKIDVDTKSFEEELKKHQDLSRAGSEKKFKGGLGDTSDTSVRYHTATHLLHQALHDVLGDSVEQKGSNITPERLRFDFSYGSKMTDEQKNKVEDIVNQKIKGSLPVNQIILPKEKALKTGARHSFNDKYGDQISVYFIGEDLNSAYSKEFCGGPHVKNTSELGHFKITKEEAVSAGVRRIKATLE